LIGAKFSRLLNFGALACERAEALIPRQQLAQLAIAIDVGYEEVDVHGLAVLAVAKRDSRASAEEAMAPGEKVCVE
jgi:hypothetical protein